MATSDRSRLPPDEFFLLLHFYWIDFEFYQDPVFCSSFLLVLCSTTNE